MGHRRRMTSPSGTRLADCNGIGSPASATILVSLDTADAAVTGEGGGGEGRETSAPLTVLPSAANAKTSLPGHVSSSTSGVTPTSVAIFLFCSFLFFLFQSWSMHVNFHVVTMVTPRPVLLMCAHHNLCCK